MQQFNAKIALTDNVSELKSLCEEFLECICQGGPTQNMVKKLAVEWNEVLETKIMLPGQISISTGIQSLVPPISPAVLTGN